MNTVPSAAGFSCAYTPTALIRTAPSIATIIRFICRFPPSEPVLIADVVTTRMYEMFIE
jgi:hypothetical protein